QLLSPLPAIERLRLRPYVAEDQGDPAAPGFLVPLPLQVGSSFVGGRFLAPHHAQLTIWKSAPKVLTGTSHQPAVPGGFLRAIREEPWRGVFEPCVDHSLTETEVEGKIPQNIRWTLPQRRTLSLGTAAPLEWNAANAPW
ncbi:unnamed protein product, partial [Pylaiella littoralis]